MYPSADPAAGGQAWRICSAWPLSMQSGRFISVIGLSAALPKSWDCTATPSPAIQKGWDPPPPPPPRHIHLHPHAAQAAQLVPGPADAAEGKIGLAPPDA